MQFSKKPEWINNGNWYKNLVYNKDRDRGIPYKEDLWVPGYFELPIEKGESVIFSASTSEENPKDYEKVYEQELLTRTSRTSFYNSLKNSAKQFYLKKPEGLYLMAGYPWYNVRARDELIALPGCTLAIDRKDDFEKMAETFWRALETYINQGEKDDTIHEIDLPDIPLWLIWAIQQFRRSYGNEECCKKYGSVVRNIVNYILEDKVKNLHMHENGLVYSLGKKTPVTWLSASLDGKPIIPRSGYIVEFNALWYNSLKFLLSLYENNPSDIDNYKEIEELSEKVKESFISTFLNEFGYLYDYVDGQYTDLEVRPNMVISIGLDYSPLDRRQKKKVLDLATRELLTPKGLRSLSPKSYAYRPVYVGNPYERELTVHQGPARPWLFGFYADAYLKIFGAGGTAFIERMLIGYEDEITEGCIGSLSELYDANPPYTGRGAVSTAKNVGEILRTIRNLKELNKLQTT